MLKKFGLIALIFVLLVSMSACDLTGSMETPPPADENGEVVDPQPGGEEAEITLYYVNDEYVITGDESLDRIIPVKRTVTVGDKAIEEIIVDELQKQPEEEGLSTEWENLVILSVETVEGMAYVNFSSQQLSGGSLQESLVLQQLVYSLTELDEVEAVQVLVDGSKAESLMGHTSIHDPLTR